MHRTATAPPRPARIARMCELEVELKICMGAGESEGAGELEDAGELEGVEAGMLSNEFAEEVISVDGNEVVDDLIKQDIRPGKTFV